MYCHYLWQFKLRSACVGAQLEVNPLERYFASEFCSYLTSSSPSLPNGAQWTPSQQYYRNIIDKLIKGGYIYIPEWDTQFSP